VIRLASERAVHTPAIERLLDNAFGPERWQKTCQRLRDAQAPLDGLSLVALAADGTAGAALVGTVRLWRVLAGGRRSLLLGPLAVDAAWQGRGIGAALITEALARARAADERSILLVGDAPYYGPFGFKAALTAGLTLPGPVDRARFLGHEFVPGALAGATGLVTPARRIGRPVPLAA
jgi:predicted N-acetyltransferase YhbS